MENQHQFFPSPAAHEGFLWVSPLGSSPAWPRAALGVLQQPRSPGCLSLCLAQEHPRLPGSVPVAPGTKAFLKANSQICCGAEPQRRPNSSFLPSSLQEL